MNLKKIHFILVFFIFCSLSISGTYASSSIIVENTLHTGDVNILLEEFQLGEDLLETTYVSPELLLPGDTVSKIPRITNLAEPCYVRAKITYPSSIEDVIPPVSESDTDEEVLNPYCLAEKDLIGLSGDWVKIQDYYYYRPILEKGVSSVLFEGVHIPEYWDSTYSEADFFVNIQVEAIQAIHVTPDYTSETPWGDVEIEVCIHNDPYENQTIRFHSLSVEYEGHSKELLAAPDDFFSNFANAMPGDTLSDTVVLTNTTDRTAEFFFRTSVPDSLSKEQLSILNEAILSISLDGKLFYHGSLCAESISSDFSLGTYESGVSREFTFTLQIPTYWENSYARENSAVEWIFSLQPEPISEVPKTGDVFMAEGYLFALCGSAGCAVLGWSIRKKNRRNLS